MEGRQCAKKFAARHALRKDSAVANHVQGMTHNNADGGDADG
jgi:hypothetical protein